jgi:hemerythrin-like domain-containing protein
MARAIEDLRQDHRNHAVLLDVLERQIGNAYAEAEPDYDIVGEIVDYFVTYSAHVHHPREDAIYDRLIARDPVAAAEIGDLAVEHDGCEAHLRAFSGALASVLGTGVMSRQVFSDAALAFTAAQRAHMAREESVFFPTALRVLTAGDWAEIELAFSREADPVFGADGHRRWDDLRSALMAWPGTAETAARKAG